MHPKSSFPNTHETAHPAVHEVLRLARRLHRGATRAPLSRSLPILRRLLATATLRNLTLPDLHRQRHAIQRKHLLQMLAAEAGFRTWESYRRALVDMSRDELPHFDLFGNRAGYPNLWFSTLEQARAHAARNGGRAVPVGRQGVIVAADACPAS